MIDIRIVCAHEALKTAETLMRLLDAEEHRTRLSYGRPSLQDLELSQSSNEAVLLIWSSEAATQHYMFEWAKGIPAERLIELARSTNAPKLAGHAAAIDFTHWRGERGGRAWNALTERLRGVERAQTPPKPVPTKAVLAVGLASVAAVAGAFAVRINDTLAPEQQIATAEEDYIATVNPEHGVGGPLVSLEPASIDEELQFSAGPRAQMLAPLDPTQFTAVRVYEPVELRDPTLIERLSALNPLNNSDDETR